MSLSCTQPQGKLYEEGRAYLQPATIDLCLASGHKSESDRQDRSLHSAGLNAALRSKQVGPTSDCGFPSAISTASKRLAGYPSWLPTGCSTEGKAHFPQTRMKETQCLGSYCHRQDIIWLLGFPLIWTSRFLDVPHPAFTTYCMIILRI